MKERRRSSSGFGSYNHEDTFHTDMHAMVLMMLPEVMLNYILRDIRVWMCVYVHAGAFSLQQMIYFIFSCLFDFGFCFATLCPPPVPPPPLPHLPWSCSLLRQKPGKTTVLALSATLKKTVFLIMMLSLVLGYTAQMFCLSSHPTKVISRLIFQQNQTQRSPQHL